MTAINPSSETVTLSWSGAAGASGYKLYRNGTLVWTSPAGSSLAAAAATTYVDAGLVANTGYSYTVTAYNSQSESAPSSGTTFNTLVPEGTVGRVGYRFPTDQARWNEFQKAPDSSFSFAIYGSNPNIGIDNGNDVYNPATVSPLIGPNIASAHSQNRGLKVLGYIDGNATPSGGLAAMKAKIDSWYATFPDLDGIYVGDAGYNGTPGDPAGRQAFIDFWSEIAAQIHARGGMAVLHGGDSHFTDLQLAATSLADMQANQKQLLRYFEKVVIYESYWQAAPNPTLYDWMLNNVAGDPYDYNFRFRYEIFVNGVTPDQVATITGYFLTRNVGYLYVTNVDLNHTVTDGSLDPADTSGYQGCVQELLIYGPATQCTG